MSAHVLFNVLIKLVKYIKCEASRAFYCFFATSLINSITQEHGCQILLYHPYQFKHERYRDVQGLH